MEKTEDKTEEKEHKIVIEIVLFGKFEDPMPMETSLKTKLWNIARWNGKFDVKYFRISVGEIVNTTAICENGQSDDDD